jgi:acetyl-CoA carboxylase carboxyl transferase subunit alpha
VNGTWLDFEKKIVELERKIEDLRSFSTAEDIELSDDIKRLEKALDRERRETYSQLTRWQRVQLARHPRRPYSLDYVEILAPDFTELHGDRLYRDDRAVVGGIASIDALPVMIVGQQKGRNLKENQARNFGMPHPEGYRKAIRLMKIGAKMGMPILCLIDTPGAFPGVEAEERGQAEAIAENLRDMARLPVPVVVVVIGEGGSGGALAMSVGDVILMMENAVYSVISPEGCAAILWRDAGMKERAAEALKLTAEDLLQLGVADEVIQEPLGGAHRDAAAAAAGVKEAVMRHFEALGKLEVEELLERRHAKYKRIGKYLEGEA